MSLESEELNWFFKDKTKQGPFLFYQIVFGFAFLAKVSLKVGLELVIKQ